ncbi:MAG: glycosyltransferase [Leptolyngbya sp.]|nr:glycosyltransferase [Candidatus Melainabacteria bacterium]
MNLFSLVFLNTMLIVCLTGLTHIFFMRFKRVGLPSIPDERLPFVSVIIPARNEETKIARCLESLAQQDYPNYEIVIIDDRSTDRTGEIIAEIASRYPHVKFVKGREMPTGWLGKCNALVQAYPHTKGEWIIFADADTCHTHRSLRYALNYAITQKTAMISFMPIQELKTFWEQVVSPVLLGSFLVGDPMNTVNDPKDDRAYAYGQYILIRRDVYDAVGGHRAVKDQILDDIMLARKVKSSGHQIMAADGSLLYKVRMYQNLETLWFGWTKNAYSLIECNIAYLALILILINTSLVGPFIHLAYVASEVAQGRPPASLHFIAPLVGIELFMLAAWFGNTKRYYDGVTWLHFFYLPLGCMMVTAIYLRSAYLVLSGNNVSWKGRQYRVNSHSTIEPQPADTEIEFDQTIAKELATAGSIKESN